jgi:hypothetical protein
MAFPRHLLLVMALVFAQLVAGVHAVEHGLGKEGAPSLHTCQLCLSAHDLGSALPGTAAPPPVVETLLTPETVSFTARSYLPPPRTSQRAPPSA